MIEQQLDEEGSDMAPSRMRKPPVTFLERVYSRVFQKAPLAERKKNARLLELLRPTRYKPDTVDQLSRETQFSKEEVKALYRAFKQECPSGISDEETFKEVYQKIFPLGDSSKYAGLVFKSIDQNKTGTVTFGQFLDFLSLLSKGSVEEKILWTFTFYDVNKDGFISRDEMLKVTIKTREGTLKSQNCLGDKFYL